MPLNYICIERTENKAELAALYSVAAVLFNPTYEDNYPTVNLESIACGTPVVTYNTGGSPEAVLKHNYGKIIDFKDYKSLLSYVNSHKNFQTIDNNAISREKMVKQYNELYESVIS